MNFLHTKVYLVVALMVLSGSNATFAQSLTVTGNFKIKHPYKGQAEFGHGVAIDKKCVATATAGEIKIGGASVGGDRGVQACR